MYNILVLGKGLLGSHIAKLYPDVPVLSRAECDITSPFDIDAVLRHYKPEVVVNCAGIVRQSAKVPDTMKLFQTNAQAPHLLQAACDEMNCKLVQVSTDCVFQGVRGNYCEIDIPFPSDLYGMSKYLGEITEYPHLTLRSSFVGFPDPPGRGLLGWASMQTGQITGYDKLTWNGLTALELARMIIDVAIPRGLSNLIHISGFETLNKYDMLVQAKEVFGWPYDVVKESDTVEEAKCHAGNMTLTSEISDLLTVNKTFKQMLQEMKTAWEK